ncbi:ead/Ea22-like family protein [Citrobacter freundii]|uniref:ead/Ea22-like family protein n=1 Tax=Citrobacter freundii TaxID=546 RepID=UPI0023B01A61|nr:ead/Ea22-like family protein [Citrobacter freundii]
MTALNKHAELRQLSEKATQGEWWSDVVETEGEYGEGEDRASGYHSYAVYVGSESLLDMTNSTAACIHTEWDHDYLMAWDETAKRNAEFIAAANPATVLALLDELEAAQNYAKERDEENQDLMLTIGRLRVERETIESERDNALCELLPGTQYMDPPDGGSITPLEQVRRMVADYQDRIAVLSASHSKLRDTMATIHNTIRMDGGYTPLAAILNAAKRAHEESASAAGIGVKGE